ncbi:hypothetical protein E9840_10270 [Tissierella creatinini]|nr:hypothetical protein E9840_10270 [Tissierella creatinini]TJX65100.1 hypothetical protein E8P77_11135 [Soehngenia saccharolytica]
MDKVLSDRLIFWMVIIFITIFFANIIYIKNIGRPVHNINVEELQNYFPNRTMNKMFKNESKNETFTHLVDFVKDGKVQIKQIDKLAKVVMVYSLDNDAIRLVYTKNLDSKNIGIDYTQDLVANRNDIIIMSPIQEGTRWWDDDGGLYEIINKDAVVETPAGRFQTLVVKYINDDFTVKEYYAEDIGLVKIVVNNFDTFELVNYR